MTRAKAKSISRYAMTRLKWKFLVLVNPGCWMRCNRPYKVWDRFLWKALVADGPIPARQYYGADYTIAIRGVEVWIGNGLFSIGDLWEGQIGKEVGCSRATALLLHSKIQEAQRRHRKATKGAREAALIEKLANAGAAA